MKAAVSWINYPQPISHDNVSFSFHEQRYAASWFDNTIVVWHELMLAYVRKLPQWEIANSS